MSRKPSKRRGHESLAVEANAATVVERRANVVGSILGWFLEEGTYVVNFADERDRLAEVEADQIVAELS